MWKKCRENNSIRFWNQNATCSYNSKLIQFLIKISLNFDNIKFSLCTEIDNKIFHVLCLLSLTSYLVVKRGDVFYADLDPIIGSEQGGIRPVLVVQNNVGNKYSPTVVVLPISSAKKTKMPTHIRIYGSKILQKNSVILAEQIRTIDRNRLQEYVGSVDLEIMKKVEIAMKISIGVSVDD